MENLGKNEVLTGEVIPEFKSYSEYKIALDAEIRAEAEGFVMIGYLLKVARDTNILAESEYADIYELAQKEYQIDKSQVSRYMNINDRFSVNGYSPMLEEQYKGFGVAKLAIMLTMPKQITEQITPDYSKSDITTLQKEIKEEEKVTEIEHMLEEKHEEVLGEGIVYRALEEMFRAKPDMLQMLVGKNVEQLKAMLSPSGDDTKIVRVPGTGKVSIRFDADITATSLRNTCVRQMILWFDLEKLLSKDNVKQLERIIGEKIEEKVEQTECEPVAPVQQKSKVEVIKTEESDIKTHENVSETHESVSEMHESEQSTLHDIEESIPEPDPVEDAAEMQQEEENIAEMQQDNTPIEGQQSIEDIPEVMPKSVIDRRTYDERKQSYIDSFVSNVNCAMANKDEGLWDIAKDDLVDAMRYLDLLIEMDGMEIEE